MKLIRYRILFLVFLPLEQPTRQRTSVQAPEHGPAGRPGAIVLKNFLFSSLKFCRNKLDRLFVAQHNDIQHNNKKHYTQHYGT
jgi:hypothetical protein